MDNGLFAILIIQFIMIILLSVMNFYQRIKRFMYGIRCKTVDFLDLRISRDVILDKDLKSFKLFNKIYVWNFARERHGTSFYVSTNSEPLNIELDSERCRYWCDSNEYNTNLKNKMLETLMMLKSKDTIIGILTIVLIVCVIGFAVMYLQTNSILEVLRAAQTTVAVPQVVVG